MEKMYFWGAIVSALFLIVLALVILIKNYNNLTAKFAASFFTFGILGLVFIYFGVYRNVPQVEVRERITQGVERMAQIRNTTATQKLRVEEEIEDIYARNEELISQYNEILRKDSTISYTRALVDPEVSSLLRFLQANIANIKNLKKLRKQLDQRVNEVDLEITKVQTTLVEWESSGGVDGDIDGYILEENLNETIKQFNQKLSFDEEKAQVTPLKEVWDALNKNRL